MNRESGFTPPTTTGHRFFSLAAALWLLISSAVACTHTRHTVEPYRSEPEAGRELERRADRLCAQRHHAPLTGFRAFVTDGCSMWPDGAAYVACCVEHDLAYWCGGTRQQRREADGAFGRCVSEAASSSALGTLMRWGVRFGGHPIFPVPYRWGYGQPYRGGYRPSDPDATAP